MLNICIDLAHHEIFRAKAGKGGININKVDHLQHFALEELGVFQKNILNCYCCPKYTCTGHPK